MSFIEEEHENAQFNLELQPSPAIDLEPIPQQQMISITPCKAKLTVAQLPRITFEDFLREISASATCRPKLGVYKKLKRIHCKKAVQCSICLHNIAKLQRIPKLACRHRFHKQCLYKWCQKNSTCPLCREEIA